MENREPRTDWTLAEMEDVARERDLLRDHVDRIWSAHLREGDEELVDFWVVGGSVRIAWEWQLHPTVSAARKWADYPARLFESEELAGARAREWKLEKEAADRLRAEREEKARREDAERRERAELARLKAKYPDG